MLDARIGRGRERRALALGLLAQGLVALVGSVAPLVVPSARAAVLSPAEFLGRPVGEDRVLFDWDTIVRYLRQVESQSDRVEIEELGRSTEGRPFLLVKIADPAGLREQVGHRERLRRLYDARSTTEEQARSIAREGRAVVAFSLGVHSTEVAASQASMEMVYELATSESPLMQRIRANLLVLIVPSMNPDGLDLVNGWYMEQVGTPSEGTSPLELYHPYAGHDNNRDGFFNNLVETAMWSKMLYHDWLPQVVIDEHQMGSNGPRLFLPPFDDPLSPSVHPLVYSQLSAAGQQVVSDLTAEGWTGVATHTIFTGEWPGSVRSTGFWHNMLGILSEVASARLATPLFFPPGAAQASGRGLPVYERRANFLEPWPGGWWRLRDIIDLDLDLTWGFLRWASERKADLLLNFWRMNRDAMERGRTEAPFAFVIPADQVDAGSAHRLARILHDGGVELHRAAASLGFGDHRVQPGAWVVRADQPFRPFVVEMLGRTEYPVVRGGDDEVVRPYDVTAWRLSELLGVRVLEVNDRAALDAFALERVVPTPRPEAVLPKDRRALFAARDLASHAVVHAALGAGARVTRASATLDRAPADFLVEAADAASLRAWTQAAGAVAREVADDELVLERDPLRRPRVAIFSPWGGSMDEGWTRLVFDRYGVDYRRARPGDPNLRGEADGRRLRRDTDVFVLPSIAAGILETGAQSAGRARVHDALWPEEYRQGLGAGDAGTALRSFVEDGGILVAINHSVPWAVEHLGLPVAVELGQAEPEDFYAPGTLVRGAMDLSHPLAAGMPSDPAFYFTSGYALRPLAWPRPTAVVARYAARDVLVAGFLTGEERLRGRPAMLEIPVGEGRVILFGFSPQRRAQTDGTFKLLLNSLLRGAAAGDPR